MTCNRTQWFSPGTLVYSTNKTDRYDITKILLKVALNTINQPNQPTILENFKCKAEFVLIFCPPFKKSCM